MISLLDLDLHDAQILEIYFQSKVDFNDCIKIVLESENFKKVFNTRKIELQIEECYKAKINVNMWISGKDTVRDFEIYDSSDWIKEEREKNNTIPKNIKHFVLELNTSGSVLDFLITKEINIIKK